MAKRKKFKNNALITAFISIIVGVLFCIFKGEILGWIMTVLGVLLIVLGIMDIINKNLTNGIIETVVGVAIIVCGWTIIDIVLIIVGVLIIVYAIMNINKVKTNDILSLLKVIGLIALGILLIVNNFAVVDWLFIVIGVIAIINGIVILLNEYR